MRFGALADQGRRDVIHLEEVQVAEDGLVGCHVHRQRLVGVDLLLHGVAGDRLMHILLIRRQLFCFDD